MKKFVVFLVLSLLLSPGIALAQEGGQLPSLPLLTSVKAAEGTADIRVVSPTQEMMVTVTISRTGQISLTPALSVQQILLLLTQPRLSFQLVRGEQKLLDPTGKVVATLKTSLGQLTEISPTAVTFLPEGEAAPRTLQLSPGAAWQVRAGDRVLLTEMNGIAVSVLPPVYLNFYNLPPYLGFWVYMGTLPPFGLWLLPPSGFLPVSP